MQSRSVKEGLLLLSRHSLRSSSRAFVHMVERDMSRSRIARSSPARILANGTFLNAATRAQGHAEQLAAMSGPTQAAEEWGRARGIQTEVLISDSIIRDMASFGVSVGMGANVSVHQCKCINNDPVSFFVKDGSNFTLSASLVYYTRQRSRCTWAGGWTHPTNAVNIGTNYGGEVRLLQNAFIGPGSMAEAMHEDFRILPQHMKSLGMWSSPAYQEGNEHFTKDSAEVPSLEALAARLPKACRPTVVDVKRRDETRMPLLAHQRPCYTVADAHWSPTSSQYYAIGNTFGFSVARDIPKEVSNVSVLLAACGDIRNLLATVSACPATPLSQLPC